MVNPVCRCADGLWRTDDQTEYETRSGTEINHGSFLRTTIAYKYLFVQHRNWTKYNGHYQHLKICPLRELEELLQEQSVLFTSWRSSLVVQLVLQNLVIVSILFNRLGDVEKIAFDRYLVGRVQERPTDIVFTKRHLILVFLGTRPFYYHISHSCLFRSL